MQFQWAEDDFDLPHGAVTLGLSEPDNQKKYVMYHGTTRRSAESIVASGFRRSEDGVLGRGVYLSRDLQKASRHPADHPDYDKVVIKVVVTVGRVIAINRRGHPLQRSWQDGYDAAWVPPGCVVSPRGLEQDCIWDPDQIQIIEVIKPLRGGARRDGRTIGMFHGTTREMARSIRARGFRQSADGMLGRGVYLSMKLEKAKRYPIGCPESDKVVIQVKVRVGKVIAINYQGHPRQKTWHDDAYGPAYDTAWVPPGCGMVKSGLEENCVWDPDRITIVKIIDAIIDARADEQRVVGSLLLLIFLFFICVFFIKFRF